MDDLGPDSKVVPLRRSQELGAEDRERLASTIFAEQDDYGTFSRGNLVPPSSPSAAGDDPAEPDEFFERVQAKRRDQTGDADRTGEIDATAEYFARLGSQTPAEMSGDASADPVPMSGSASRSAIAHTRQPPRRT